MFCLHFTASCIPGCYNDWTLAGGGLKNRKISTTGFELAAEWCEVQSTTYWPDFALTCRSLLPSRFTFHHAQLQQLQLGNTPLHYTRQRVPLALNTAHSTPDHLAASQAHVLYGSANWQGARMMDDCDLWFQFSRVPLVLVYRSISLYEKFHQQYFPCMRDFLCTNTENGIIISRRQSSRLGWQTVWSLSKLFILRGRPSYFAQRHILRGTWNFFQARALNYVSNVSNSAQYFEQFFMLESVLKTKFSEMWRCVFGR